jgi:hypothetical protein
VLERPGLRYLALTFDRIGVSIASGPGRVVRTKVVTLTPRFVVANKSCWSARGYGIGIDRSIELIDSIAVVAAWGGSRQAGSRTGRE